MLHPHPQQSHLISMVPVQFQAFHCAPHAHHGCTSCSPGHGCTLTLQTQEALQYISVSHLLQLKVSHLITAK